MHILATSHNLHQGEYRPSDRFDQLSPHLILCWNFWPASSLNSCKQHCLKLIKLYFTAGTPTTVNLNSTVTIQEGDSVNITCFSSGNPVPTISWYLGDSLAPFPDWNSVEEFQAVVTGNRQFAFTEGNITSVLQITNAVYPAHDGVYTCVGLNSHRGRDNTSNATITVQVQGMRLVALDHISLTCTTNGLQASFNMFSQQILLEFIFQGSPTMYPSSYFGKKHSDNNPQSCLLL